MLRKFLRQLEMTRSNLLHWHLQNKAYFYFWCYWSAKAATWVTISNLALRKWTQKIARESRTKAMGKAQQQEYNQLLYYVYIYISLLLLNYGIKNQSIMGLSADVGWVRWLQVCFTFHPPGMQKLPGKGRARWNGSKRRLRETQPAGNSARDGPSFDRKDADLGW